MPIALALFLVTQVLGTTSLLFLRDSLKGSAVAKLRALHLWHFIALENESTPAGCDGDSCRAVSNMLPMCFSDQLKLADSVAFLCRSRKDLLQRPLQC